VAPFYYEFRIRGKEIDGKVSAIEQAVIASKEGHAELLERLTAIEDKLNSIQRELESHIKSSR
jgi:DNA-binding FrmR family transcriptional regulator